MMDRSGISNWNICTPEYPRWPKISRPTEFMILQHDVSHTIYRKEYSFMCEIFFHPYHPKQTTLDNMGCLTTQTKKVVGMTSLFILFFKGYPTIYAFVYLCLGVIKCPKHMVSLLIKIFLTTKPLKDGNAFSGSLFWCSTTTQWYDNKSYYDKIIK